MGLAGLFIRCAKTLITPDEQLIRDWFIIYSQRWNERKQKERKITTLIYHIVIPGSFNQIAPRLDPCLTIQLARQIQWAKVERRAILVKTWKGEGIRTNFVLTCQRRVYYLRKCGWRGAERNFQQTLVQYWVVQCVKTITVGRPWE